MAERPCIIEGCTGVTGVRGTARCWCSTHYQRWQRTGDPLGVLRKRNHCTVEGCATLAYGNGYCLMHYTRWKRHGKLCPPHLPRELEPGERWCSDCKEIKAEGGFYPNVTMPGGFQAECKECCKARRRRYLASHPQSVERVAAVCGTCGSQFQADKRNRVCCSDDCRRLVRRQVSAERRALRRGATVEPVSPLVVFTRDAWQCGICGLAIDRVRNYPDPQSASVDHIRPLTKGGAHSMANVQASHLLCNMQKSNIVKVAVNV